MWIVQKVSIADVVVLNLGIEVSVNIYTKATFAICNPDRITETTQLVASVCSPSI